MRILLLTTLLTTFGFAVQAQTPDFQYAPATTNNSGFFFGNDDIARHNQTLYPNGLLGLPSCTVNVLYFRYGSVPAAQTGTTIDSLVIRLGHTDEVQLPFVDNNTNGFLPVATFAKVHASSTFSIPGGGANGDWFQIPLTTPFQYDSSRSLVLDIRFLSCTNQVFGVRAATVSGQRVRVYTENLSDTEGSNSSSLVPHLGFGLPTATRPMLAGLGLIVSNPLPGTATIAIPASLQGKELVVFDAAGKAVRRERLTSELQLAGLTKGLYLLKAEDGSQRLIVE